MTNPNIPISSSRRTGWAKREADLVKAEQAGWPSWMRSASSPSKTSGDLFCQKCERENPVWWVDNDLWNEAVGTRDNPRGEGIVLCPSCFVRKFRKAEYA